jgi:drug/metabolite transporter (DMT)-like permease
MTDLPVHVTLLVLFAGLLHATWNALLKSRHGDALLDTASVTLGNWVVVAVALPFVSPPAPPSWPFLAVSAVLHFGYLVALAGAYRHGDLGFAYPVMRGTAPLLVTLSGAVFLGETPTPAMWAGILLISAGILALARPRGNAAPSRSAIAWALGNAAIIASYSVVDGAGARLSGNALGYVVWLLFIESIPFVAYAAWQRRGRMAAHLRATWLRGLVGGACSVGGYAIVLWAMTRAPVGVIAALRETSVLFAAVIAAVLLKEPFGPHRLAGAGLVVGGVVALKA